MTKNILFLLGLISLTLASCNKGCEFPEDENTGDIIADAIVLAGNTGGIPSVHQAAGNGQFDFRVSFDNGYTYVPMDSTMFTKYTIINFPLTAGCNTHYERNVDITTGLPIVSYTITVESCPDCEEEYRTDNWVLVKKFPSNYAVDLIKKVK